HRSSFLFFQAEDGIRHFHVTGVQTCALPIFQRSGANEGQLALPGRYRRALIYFEDKNFESHPGIDIGAVARASFQNLAAGRVVSGASTITMQLARLVLGSRERGLGDKIVEALAALRLETLSTKDEILRLYADLAPFGKSEEH